MPSQGILGSTQSGIDQELVYSHSTTDHATFVYQIHPCKLESNTFAFEYKVLYVLFAFCFHQMYCLLVSTFLNENLPHIHLHTIPKIVRHRPSLEVMVMGSISPMKTHKTSLLVPMFSFSLMQVVDLTSV